MVFTTSIFLFLFLPLLIAVHALVPSRARNALLLLASLIFYAWGEGAYVCVMLVSIMVNQRFGLALRKRGPAFDKAVLASSLVFNLGLLGVFKYAGFVSQNLRFLGVSLQAPQVHMPIGISFFTFHAISYLLDIHRGKAEAQDDSIDFALYIALFPQLVAGPIVRYHELAGQLGARRIELAGFAGGVRRFIIGFAKKMLIANTLAHAANTVFDVPFSILTTGEAWLGALAYTGQIYFDFSGYSDMAIGLAALFGFRFPENFRTPYAARSVTDFWRRWHISLSSWFRDYLYIPLGGNRKGRARELFNLVTVFFLCGLWHGASWTFVLWGLYHGAFLVLERVSPEVKMPRVLRPLQHAWTMLVVIGGWVLFRAADLPRALGILRTMAGSGAGSAGLPGFFEREQVIALTVAVLASGPLVPWLVGLRDTWAGRGLGVRLQRPFAALEVAGLAALLLAGLAQVAAGTFNPFIYYRF